MSEELPGTTLGERYTLEKLLGEGGFASVWRARDHEQGVSVAIKILHPRHAQEPTMIRRLKDEYTLASRVADLAGHVRRVHSYAVTQGHHYLVMEYLEGETLHDKLASGIEPGARPTFARQVLTQICQGLATAVSKGVAHRDLTPGNLFLVETEAEPHIKILDFGNAKEISGPTRVQSDLIGTEGYVAPELYSVRARGVAPDYLRADVYSLGVIFCEILTGKPPPFAPSPSQLYLHRNLARETGTHITDAQWQIVERCVARDPCRRFDGASDLGVALRYLASAPKTAPLATPPTYELSESEGFLEPLGLIESTLDQAEDYCEGEEPVAEAAPSLASKSRGILGWSTIGVLVVVAFISMWTIGSVVAPLLIRVS